MKVIGMTDDRINVKSGGFDSQNAVKDEVRRQQAADEDSISAPSRATKRKRIEEQQEEEDEYRELPAWLSVILWLLRKSIVPVIMIVMLIVGLYVGYVYLGDQPKDEVFKWSTWRHLYDLIFAES